MPRLVSIVLVLALAGCTQPPADAAAYLLAEVDGGPTFVQLEGSDLDEFPELGRLRDLADRNDTRGLDVDPARGRELMDHLQERTPGGMGSLPDAIAFVRFPAGDVTYRITYVRLTTDRA